MEYFSRIIVVKYGPNDQNLIKYDKIPYFMKIIKYDDYLEL